MKHFFGYLTNNYLRGCPLSQCMCVCVCVSCSWQCVHVCGQCWSSLTSTIFICTFAHGQWNGKIQRIFNQCIAQVCGELLRKQVTKWVSATGMFLQLSIIPSCPLLLVVGREIRTIWMTFHLVFSMGVLPVVWEVWRFYRFKSIFHMSWLNPDWVISF